MRMQWGWTGLVAIIFALSGVCRSAEAQYVQYTGPGGAPGYGGPQAMMGPGMPGPNMAGPGMAGGMVGSNWSAGPVYPGGVMPAAYDPGMGAPPGMPMPNEGGPGYGGPAYGGPGMDYGGPMEYGDGGECPFCGGAGCRNCRGVDGVARNALRHLLPYGEGGACAPRWFDVHMEAMYLTRENVSRFVPFSSDGPAGFGAPVIVLSSNNLDFDPEAGMKFTGALHVWNQYNLEFTYSGLFNWSARAQATSGTNDLFSVLSGYGTNPPPAAPNLPLFLGSRGGFDQTDAADIHSIAYSSSFDNYELNLRKRWTGVNCRIQGSTMWGARYVYLDEDFRHFTRGHTIPGSNAVTGTMDYLVGTGNSMTGMQIGGDLWTSVIPGLSVGADVKAGLMANHAGQQTQITSQLTNLAAVTYNEAIKDTDLALLAEANLMSIWKLNPHWTIRTGYNFMYFDGVALGIENFNPVAPPTFGVAGRTTTINHNGSILLHGFTAGMEWMW